MNSYRHLMFSFLILTLFSPLTGRSQVFGGLPAHQEWRFIKSGPHQILFNPSMTSWAKRIHQSMPLLDQQTYALGSQTRPISIILQNHTTLSNGYVALGPWRSEFYTTPLQNSLELGSLPWQDQLLLHEGRHIHQYANLTTGLTKFFRFLAGDYGQDFYSSMIIPNFFWEGDAVWQETFLSQQGRGRLPHFFGTTRALHDGGKTYHWQKLRSGSLQDLTPDHYQLGYQLTAYGYHQYGPDFWKKVTTDALQLKGVFYPFQKAIQKYSGLSYTKFRQKAFAYFQENSTPSPNESAQWARTKKHFQGDAHFPQWINDSMLIYLKTSYDHIPTFTLHHRYTGVEAPVVTRCIALDEYFSYRNGTVVYASQGFDKRWGWKDYGEITLLNIEEKTSQTITCHGKYFAPDINSTGDRIVAVAIDSAGATGLHIMDRYSGQILARLTNLEGDVYTYPKFLSEDSVVVAVRKENAHMGLMQWQPSTGKTQWLLEPRPGIIAYPNSDGNSLYFTATYQGNDEVFLMSIGSGAIYRPKKLNEGNAGHYAIMGDLNKITWTDQTSVGKRLRTIRFTDTPWENITDSFKKDRATDFGMQLFKPMAREQKMEATASEYSKLNGLFQIHSWLPYSADPEYSLTAYTENVLNTMQGELGLLYNRNEGSTKLFGTATYGGLYPWLHISVGKTLNRKGSTGYNSFSFHETTTSIGWSVPLNLSGAHHYRSLQVGSHLNYAISSYLNNFKDSFAAKRYSYSTAFIRFTNQRQQARKDIYPRIAQSLFITAHQSVATFKGFQWLVNGILYLPGLVAHHHIVLQGALQQRDTLRQIFYSNAFPFTRGYMARNGQWMQKIGINYHVPIAYPDQGIGNLVYLLRIRENFFYDQTQWQERYQGVTYKRAYRSIGTEIFFDTKWWNQEPFSIGIRYSRLLDAYQTKPSRNQWELVMPVLIK